jgi:hypothetical protein
MMAYKIKLSKIGTRKQILDTKNNVFITKKQAKEINKLASEKNVTGIIVYLDKEKS